MSDAQHYLLLRALPFGTVGEVILHGPEADAAVRELNEAGIRLPRTFHPHTMDQLTALATRHDAARVIDRIGAHLKLGRVVTVELRPITGSRVLAKR